MDTSLVAMLGAIAFATYFQTVTGFGMGMIALGAASGFQLMPLGTAAVAVSLLTLLTSPLVLAGKLHHLDRRALGALLLGMIPAIYGGVWLLDYLSRSASTLLQFLLGTAITAGCAVLAVKPVRRDRLSSPTANVAAGAFAGLFGGLFGFSGPPLVFHLYRQPLEQVVVRSTLVTMFACSATIRVAAVGMQGGLDAQVWLIFATATPLVVAATFLGRRYPPPLSPPNLRRLAFVAVGLMGAGLMASALGSMN